jgi:hypothetical protein
VSCTDVRRDLEAIAADGGFQLACHPLVERWTAAGVGAEAIGPILGFMEDHPAIDFGAPGPLVHFMERFDRALLPPLLESVTRRPTATTVIMVQRWLNSFEDDPAAKRPLLDALRVAREHPGADDVPIAYLDGVLAQHG